MNSAIYQNLRQASPDFGSNHNSSHADVSAENSSSSETGFMDNRQTLTKKRVIKPPKKKNVETPDSPSKDKYYRKFDFFYRRTAFRTMTEYYKARFKPMLEKWRDAEKRAAAAMLAE